MLIVVRLRGGYFFFFGINLLIWLKALTRGVVIFHHNAKADILCPGAPIWSTWVSNVDQMGAHGHKMSSSATMLLMSTSNNNLTFVDHCVVIIAAYVVATTLPFVALVSSEDLIRHLA